MQTRTLGPLCGALAVALVAAPARAQDRIAAIDSIFRFATPTTPGCAVGASQRGKVLVNKAYGLASVERTLPLTPSSNFDIASNQKQFVAAAILLLVEDGRLALTDDVRKHVPQLPDYGHRITIDHLLTHTSGLRDWTGLLPMAEEGTDVMSLILRQRGLNFAPGTEWAYSNSGYVLLKEIVARASGMSFADFARRRLFEPLGMKSTAYVADIMQATGDRAFGYQRDGTGWKPFMRLGTNRGGGAVVSNTTDLLAWNDALTSGRLGKLVTAKLQEEAKLASGRRLTYARGLNVNHYPGASLVSHSGGAAGYSSWLGRLTNEGLSVVVLCNFDPVSATDLAHRVVNAIVPLDTTRAKAAAPAAAGAAVTAQELNGKAGLFFDERTGEPLRLVVVNGRLGIAGVGPLVPVSADRFRPQRASLYFRSEDAYELHFPSADHVELKSTEGQVTRYRRAQPWTPAAADLASVDGRYESAELGSVFEIVPGTNTLVMRMEHAPERTLELTPVERDTYMRSMMIVRFRRDATGKVTGFDYGNPVARGIAFTRLGDRTRSAAAPAPATPPAAPAAAPAAASATPRLESLVGFYEGPQAGVGIEVTLENGALFGVAGGGAKLPLLPKSGATFWVGSEGAPRTVAFTMGTDGRATALVLRAGSNERTFTRVR